MTARFVADPVLAELKDFQRDTARHVFRRLYVDDPPAHRFLIADEVGLGKTFVARGIIAQAIEHLQDRVERIDVLYVCSNGQIAAQNLRRLRIPGVETQELAQRLTMLPLTARQLDRGRVNLIAFTPGTSFDLKRGSGRRDERLLLRLLLEMAWGEDVSFRTAGSFRAFQGGVQSFDRFKKAYRQFARTNRDSLEPTIVASFIEALGHADDTRDTGGPTMRERFDEIAYHCRDERVWRKAGWRDRRARSTFIGDLRDLLARACLQALEPDLIVLDEFQRFKHLLEDPNADGAQAATVLAHELFEFVDQDARSNARTLLLSATPYKMLTHADDTDEDHHADLLETVRFLVEHDDAQVQALRRWLSRFRSGLFQAGRDGGAAAREPRREVERILRRVMVRTERLAATPDRDGMLRDVVCEGLRLDPDEVRRFVADARLTRELGDVQDPLEFWKSAPYLLNFMDGYQFRKVFDHVVEEDGDQLADAVAATVRLDWDALARFEPIDPANFRLRWLQEDVIDRGAWQLLWMPPSLPYLTPAGPYADPTLQRFTKRLIFSSWRMVPTAVSALLSYEAERRMVSTGRESPAYTNTPQDRARRARLLEFTRSEGRLAGMPVFGILYPSVVLAREGDPLALARAAGGTTVSTREAIATVAKRFRGLLEDVRTALIDEGVTVRRDGPADQRWYWAAPIWLDWLDDAGHTDAFFQSVPAVVNAFTTGDEETGSTGLRDHIRRAQQTAFDENPEDEVWGPMPDDAPDVLARMALAGPGVVALRALARVSGIPVDDLTLRFASCQVAWGIRSLFNTPEVIELVRGLLPGDPYWQRVLDYAIDGNLQAVLDEYAHVLAPAEGYIGRPGPAEVTTLAAAMASSVHLRTANYGVGRVELADGRVPPPRTERMRAHFAVRLSGGRSDEGGQQREGEVRDAFNSPFWPFVLTTTSAGQEGLDFHQFAHAIVHWNLPSNPVDLEQREGRVHRFKGHAVRRNVAAVHGAVGLVATGDPWQAMFDAAHAVRDGGVTEIVPYWVHADREGAAIERYVPALPLSRDHGRATTLRRAVASYRLAFGQPRQDELLAYLAGEVDADELARLADELRIDVSPNGFGPMV
ncbi:helicase-related protein [Euzebya sp.]|uniref:helicase-related protein n=1 Tax=Euzebya sp. TaxID=1971409 RepID=UPI003511A078